MITADTCYVNDTPRQTGILEPFDPSKLYRLKDLNRYFGIPDWVTGQMWEASVETSRLLTRIPAFRVGSQELVKGRDYVDAMGHQSEVLFAAFQLAEALAGSEGPI